MRHLAIITLLGTLGTMAPAIAQTPPQPPPMAQQHFSRTEAQTETLSALSFSHRMKTQTILTDLKAGKITDVLLAAEQIDAVLDANEARDVLTVRDHFVREQRHMRRRQPSRPPVGGPLAQAPNPNMNPEAPPPGSDVKPMAPPRSDREPQGRPGMRNDAGLAIIMINLDSKERHTLFEHRRPA